jgi:hypothetical protein
MGKSIINLLTVTLVCSCLAGFTLAGCGDDDDTNNTAKNKDAAVVDSGSKHPDSGTPACFVNPKTHQEIINACTDAEFIDKTPVLPLLLPDGGLPPLP